MSAGGVRREGRVGRKYGSGEDSDRTIGEAFLRVIFCLKGPILASARPLAVPPASSLITRCQLTLLATGQFIVLGYLITGHILQV